MDFQRQLVGHYKKQDAELDGPDSAGFFLGSYGCFYNTGECELPSCMPVRRIKRKSVFSKTPRLAYKDMWVLLLH